MLKLAFTGGGTNGVVVRGGSGRAPCCMGTLLVAMFAAACVGNGYLRWDPETATHERSATASQRAKGLSQSLEGATRGLDDAFSVLKEFRLRSMPPTRDGAAKPLPNEWDALAAQNEDVLEVLYGEERHLIRSACRDPSIGVALSGGGIRSASFAVGALQALQQLQLLQQVGYLSTVSGGGFAGGWYITHGPQSLDWNSLDVQHLARNGHYLTRGHSSRSAGELTGTIVKSALLLPVAALVDVLFHTEANTNGLRTAYLRGIHRTFFYEQPFVEPDEPEEVGFVFTPGAPPRATLADYQPSLERSRPFWVVNAHLILNDDFRFRSRSGEAFEITPLRAGSDAVGYVDVPSSRSGGLGIDHFWMSPACAAAISGAAADSESLQQGAIPSLLLYYLNLDLGYFIPGWGPGWVKGDDGAFFKWLGWACTSPFLVHDLLMPVASFFLRDRPACDRSHLFRADARSYGVTDGGHFENLGLYALVRRGCQLIVVVDATEDAPSAKWDTTGPHGRASAFTDYRKSMQLIEADFGAVIENGLDGFATHIEHSCGRDRRGPVFKATIANLPLACCGGKPGGQQVVILYVKAAFDSPLDATDLPAAIVAEAREDPRFPHRPTFDSLLAGQLYEEQAFQAYRLLGYRTILQQRSLFLDEFRRLRSPDGSTIR